MTAIHHGQTQTWDTERLLELDLAHVLHPVTNLHRHAKSGPLILTRGDGIHVWDSAGKRYIDGFAGLWNINVGHGSAAPPWRWPCR